MRQTESLHVAIHAAKGTNRMAEVGESVNITSCVGVSFHSDKKRECTRMGKRMYGIRSFAYRIPHPHAAAASRLRLPRIWNPSLSVHITKLLRQQKPQSHQAYDQVTTYLRTNNVAIEGKSKKERTTGRRCRTTGRKGRG